MTYLTEIFYIILSAQISSQTSEVTSTSSDEPVTIIVEGARMSELEAALQRCIAGGCTPREDVIASVRYAEALFREGDYRNARDVLGRSVSRNKLFSADDPLAYAELNNARATVAWHYGDQREALRATAESSRTLRNHRPGTINALTAELRLIDAQQQSGEHRGADITMNVLRQYEGLAERARELGYQGLALKAELRRAVLINNQGDSRKALAIIDDAISAPGAGIESYRLAARILRARLAAKSGDETAINNLVAEFAATQAGVDGPVLIYSPRIPPPNIEYEDDAAVAFSMGVGPPGKGSQLLTLRWADIGFLIGPDGRVESADYLRGSRDNGWAAPLLSMIRQRRYTPAKNESDQTGRYRVERYTLTGDFEVASGSLIRRRMVRPRFEQIDLTGPPPS